MGKGPREVSGGTQSTERKRQEEGLGRGMRARDSAALRHQLRARCPRWGQGDHRCLRVVGGSPVNRALEPA